MSGGIGRTTASAGEQNVHGIDKQSIRSVASARGQRVRGVDKQVGVLGVGNKVRCPQHERANDRPATSASERKYRGVSKRAGRYAT